MQVTETKLKKLVTTDPWLESYMVKTTNGEKRLNVWSHKHCDTLTVGIPIETKQGSDGYKYLYNVTHEQLEDILKRYSHGEK